MNFTDWIPAISTTSLVGLALWLFRSVILNRLVLTPRICDLEYPEVVKPVIPQPSDPAIPPEEKNRDYPALIEKVSLPY
jgi:hypothetical protein